MSKRAKLVARFRQQCAALARTARQIADEDASHQYLSLGIHHFPGHAPVVIQTFATVPGTIFYEDRII